MEDIVTAYGGVIGVTRNATGRSRLAERILTHFLRSRADLATVRWQKTSYSLEELYKGLWNCCQKPPYKGRVRVSMRKDQLILRSI